MRKKRRYTARKYNAETSEWPPASCEHKNRQMAGFVMVDGRVRGVCRKCYYAHPDVMEAIAEKKNMRK